MNLLIFNDPFDLSWQANLYDVLMLSIFVTVVVHAIVQWRRGTRTWMFLLIASFVYGQVIELGGMATLNMYQQGDFAVMLNYPAIPLFEGTTAMPFYVTIFYPVIFAIGFKVVDALGIASRIKAAITGGLFMVLLDAPYSIEGGLRHVVWWTYDPDFKLFEFWLGWPLLELTWQAIWGAAFYYFMLRHIPRVDGPVEERVGNGRLLAVQAPLAALSAIAVGLVAMSPITITSLLGIPQWIVVSLLMIGYVAVVVPAMRGATPPRGSVDPWLMGWAVWFAVAFGAMVIGNLVYENGMTLDLTVQTLGIVGVLALATFPLWAPGRATADARRETAAASRS